MEDCRLWHLCWRAAIGRDFVADERLAQRIVQQIVTAHDRPGRILVSFHVAADEIHILSRLAPGEGPGALAPPFSALVSRWLRQGSQGRRPVYAGRVAAHPMAGDTDLRSQVRMLGWRPVLGTPYRSPSQVPHTALRVALGFTPARGYDCRPLLSLFGESLQEAREGLRRLLRGRPAEPEIVRWRLVSRLAPLDRGPHERATRVPGVPSEAAALLVAAGAGGLQGALALLETWICRELDLPANEDIRAVCDAAGARARALVGCLAVHHGLCSGAAVARYFGRSRATLAEQMLKVRRSGANRLLARTSVECIVGEAIASRSLQAPDRRVAPTQEAFAGEVSRASSSTPRRSSRGRMAAAGGTPAGGSGARP